MGHFYTQQKRQTPINYQRQKKKKNSAKTSLKKNRKTHGQRMQKKKKKKKNETSGQNSIAFCWHNTNLHMRQMSFVGKIDHLANVVFRMANNIACCCASMGTRILLTSLVDLVTGCVRTKWLTWNHCEAKKKKKKRRRTIQICVKFCEQICFSSLFLFKEEDQTNRVYNYVPSFRLPSNW